MYTIRDGILRRIARRRDLVVPSLLADVRIETGEIDIDMTKVLSSNGARAGRTLRPGTRAGSR
jgi:hypothetical protein